MDKFLNKVSNFLGQMTKMSITEWVLFVGALLVFFLIMAHPIKSILIFVIVWFVSLPFRNFIKRVIAKWKS